MKFMKTPSKFSSIILLISSLVFSACSSAGGLSSASTPTVPAATPSAAPIVLVDGLEREITLGNQARRIVSLAPSNTEILFAIGAGGLVVGRDTFSDYPVEALAIADIGGGFGELNTEAIVSLDPDLVLAAEITPPEQILALKNLGLEVFALLNPVEFEQLFNNLKITGILTGNVYMDITGLPPQNLLNYFPELEKNGEKVVFGSDWPTMPSSIKKNIETIKSLPLSDHTIEAILFRNAQKILFE